jgi:hypothetical protein
MTSSSLPTLYISSPSPPSAKRTRWATKQRCEVELLRDDEEEEDLLSILHIPIDIASIESVATIAIFAYLSALGYHYHGFCSPFHTSTACTIANSSACNSAIFYACNGRHQHRQLHQESLQCAHTHSTTMVMSTLI